MSTTKLMDNNRRTHAAKVLAEASKKNQHPQEGEHTTLRSQQAADNTDFSAEASETNTEHEIFSQNTSINEQFHVIRQDILKLREDLAHGYDLVKDWVETKMSIRTLLRSK